MTASPVLRSWTGRTERRAHVRAPRPTPLALAAPDLDEGDVQAVLAVLRDGRLALGPQVAAFESAVAERVGVRHAVAASSGTAALHMIVRALGLGPGDQVLVPAFTFAASLNAFLYEGAEPVFVEVDPATRTVDPEDLARRITPRSRAVMVVDTFGHPAPWDRLEALAARHGLILIDDCCEALGAEFRGRPLGAFGAAGAFAFYPNKQITTGEGGMVVTDDAALAARCRALANQGRDAAGAWLQHAYLGHNYRMDEMSASLGRSQLARLDAILARREAVAARYAQRLASLPGVSAPTVGPDVRMSWFVYVVTLAPDLDRDALMAGLEADGIPVRGYFAPLHTQPYVRARLGDLRGTLPVTEALARRTLALPFHNRLSEAEIEHVTEALRRHLRMAGHRSA